MYKTILTLSFLLLIGPLGHCLPDVENNDKIFREEASLQVDAGFDGMENKALLDFLFEESKSGQYSQSYKQARLDLFYRLNSVQYEQGEKTLTTFYCGKKITESQNGSIGKSVLPSSSYINTEHVWPQSKFTSKVSKSYQKTDLHHLYPVLSKVNSYRSSHPFGDVVKVQREVCEGVFLGKNANGHTVFEPRDEVKGDVARAVLYFSTRYRVNIGRTQEETLKQWHLNDPVSREEIERNDLVQKYQGNRNPFVDYEALVGAIEDF